MSLTNKHRLFEIMSKVDKSFKGKLNENYDNGKSTDESYKPYKSYSNDPRWITAKYDGVSKNGEPFKRGDKILYYPSTKDIYAGEEAEKNYRDFESHAADEYQMGGDLYENSANDINPKYTHFALSKEDNKIVNGWDYNGYDKEELRQFKNDYFAQDLLNMDIKPNTVNILTPQTLKRRGIEPYEINNWRKFNESLINENNIYKNQHSIETINMPIIPDAINVLSKNNNAIKFTDIDEFKSFLNEQRYFSASYSHAYDSMGDYKNNNPNESSILLFETGHEIVATWDSTNNIGYIIPDDKKINSDNKKYESLNDGN